MPQLSTLLFLPLPLPYPCPVACHPIVIPFTVTKAGGDQWQKQRGADGGIPYERKAGSEMENLGVMMVGIWEEVRNGEHGIEGVVDGEGGWVKLGR